MNSDEEKVHKFIFIESFETIKENLGKIPQNLYSCSLYHGFREKRLGDVINMWKIEWYLYKDNRYLGMLRPDVELFCFEMYSKQEFIGDNLHKLIGTIQKFDYEKIILFLYENSEKGFSEEEFQDVCGITFDPNWEFELP